MISGRSWKRYAIVAPGFALLVGGVALTSSAILVWGDTGAGLHPDWLPALVVLQLGAPILLAGTLTFFLVWRDTRYAFQVSFPQILSGVFTLGLGIWAVLLAEEATRDGVYEGTVFRVDPEDSAAWVAAGALPLFVVLSAVLVLTSYAYSRSINAHDPSKWDKRPDEPDAIGSILNSRSG